MPETEKKTPAKNWITLKRILRTTINNFWRNKFLTSATIILMALIIFIFNIIVSINSISNEAISSLNSKVDIIVYIENTADFIEVNNLIEDLRSFPEVTEAIFTSKEKALEEILATFPGQDNPFDLYGLENTLPANIQIITGSPQSHPAIIKFLYEGKYSHILKDVKNNQENQKTAEKLLKITDASKKIIYGIIISFFIGGFLIIINGVQLTIHSRREEIRIMKLVGASYTYIKSPFILEGLLYGTAAALLGIILLLIFMRSINLTDLGVNFQLSNHFTIILVEIIAGMLLGTIASFIATERYIRKMN